MADTFISYRREDSAGYAGRLRQSLERRLGEARVFRDVDTILPGQDFVDAIEARLAACHVMLVVIGREWMGGGLPSGDRRLDNPYDFVRLEVAAGLARHGVLVIPVLVEGAVMPSAGELPENIRPLARRHAVSVRDETWDGDVDRLTAVIDRIPSRDSVLPAWLQSRRTAAAIAAAATVLAIGAAVWLMRSGRDAEPSAHDAATATASAAPTAATAPPVTSGSYTIDIPPIAEAVFDRLVITLVSGNMVQRGNEHELRLRMRLSNAGPNPVNFWDQGFRLAVNQELQPPASGLNEVVAGNSLRYSIVSFRVPSGTRSGSLRVIQGAAVADVPLDLSTTGRAPVDEQAPIEDSLSQAIVRRLIATPAPLVETSETRVTLLGATSRRFVNARRVTFSLRLENRHRYPFHSGSLLLRAAVNGSVVTPLEPSNQVIDGMATATDDVVFDLPPSATRAVVTATLGTQAAELVLDLGAN